MVDDFRRDLIPDDEDDAAPMPYAVQIDDAPRRRTRDFLGLSAPQRALLSFLLFLNVLVVGGALLLVTGRLALPF